MVREEELSEDVAMRGIEAELPSIPLPESIPKPIKEENISIGKESVSERKEREEFLLSERRRSYVADIKDAIKKSRQKARERSKKHNGKESIETPRIEEDKRSSLGGAGTIGLFTPLQLVIRL